MTVTPRRRRFSDFSMSKPTLTSSTGSADSETRIVSPIPDHSSMPSPIEDLTVPLRRPPASVMPEMERVVAGFGELLIGGDGEKHVGRLARDLELEEIVVLEDLGVVERALDHRFGAGLAVALEEVALERAGIDADPHRAAVVLRRLDHFAHAVRRADVAGVDAQARGAALRRLDRPLVVEMDVGDDRHRHLPHDVLQRQRRFLVGAGDADDVGAGLFERPDLLRPWPRRRSSRCWSSTAR